MVICLERCADLHMAQLMLLPLTVSCFSKIQIGFAFLVPAHPGSPGKRAVKRGVCVCVCVCSRVYETVIHPSVCTNWLHATRGLHTDGISVPSPPFPAPFTSISSHSSTPCDPSPPVPIPASFHLHPSPSMLCSVTFQNTVCRSRTLLTTVLQLTSIVRSSSSAR